MAYDPWGVTIGSVAFSRMRFVEPSAETGDRADDRTYHNNWFSRPPARAALRGAARHERLEVRYDLTRGLVRGAVGVYADSDYSGKRIDVQA